MKKKTIHDSCQEVKISTLTGVWKRLNPTFMDGFEDEEVAGREEPAAGGARGWSCL